MAVHNIDPTVDRLAFLDLDGTLIDTSYEVTDPSIYDAIAATQDSGWRIGLHSDTPYEALHVWRKRFGMNGPIIAEKGAVVEVDGRLEMDVDTSQGFSETRSAALIRFESQGIHVWSGSPVEALRAGLRIGEVDERVVLLHAFSQASLRFFVRRVSAQGELRIDTDATEELVAQVRGLYPTFDDIVEEMNPDYGLVIVSRARYTKRIGALRLMAARGLRRVVMIGNSMSDDIGSDIAWHGAVGDATPAFQARSDYAAKGGTTAGVVEILGKLRLDGQRVLGRNPDYS